MTPDLDAKDLLLMPRTEFTHKDSELLKKEEQIGMAKKTGAEELLKTLLSENALNLCIDIFPPPVFHSGFPLPTASMDNWYRTRITRSTSTPSLAGLSADLHSQGNENSWAKLNQISDGAPRAIKTADIYRKCTGIIVSSARV